ncbi:MAG: hypothetical protein JNK16_16330 [Phycisphaerales bacterium]|nr:hypothetical protein [Phycisphaerales bacterium]
MQSGSLDINEADGSTPRGPARPFLQVLFRCGPTYVRVYRKKSGEAYDARCPKCGRRVTFRVGPGGSSSRAFEVDCGR